MTPGEFNRAWEPREWEKAYCANIENVREEREDQRDRADAAEGKLRELRKALEYESERCRRLAEIWSEEGIDADIDFVASPHDRYKFFADSADRFDKLLAALDQETKEPQQTTSDGTPQFPFLYGREQGDGSFKDALDNLLADLRGLLFAANPGQQVVIDREHIDRDGFYFTARTLPYLTEVQFKAAAASERGDI